MTAIDTEVRDERFEEAAALCREHGQISAELLRKKMLVGYPRATKLVGQLRAAKVLGDSLPDAEQAPQEEIVPARMIALDALTPSPFNAARMQAATQESLQGLAEAMRERGQLQAIVVRDLGDGSYRIVAGERRYRAALLNGWKTIRAEIRNYATDDEEKIDTVMENLQRVDLPPLVEADGIAALRRAGQSVEDISRKLGLSASAVYSRLRLGNLSPAWREELADPKSKHAGLADKLSWLEDLAALPHTTWVDARFPRDERCKGCAYRTDATGLFPEYNDSKTAQCCRPACWSQKQARWLSMQIADALKAGQPVALYSDSYRAVLDAIPQEHRSAVEGWPRYNNEDELYESREDAQDGEEREVVEIRTLHLDGPRMGQYVTMYSTADLACDRDDDADEGGQDNDQPTPMMLACREILERFLPEIPAGSLDVPLPVPSMHDLLRLAVLYRHDMNCLRVSNDSDAVILSAFSSDEQMAQTIWRDIYASIYSRVEQVAESAHYHMEVEDFVLVFGWMGLPAQARFTLENAAAAMQGSTENEPAGDADGEDNVADDGEV